MQFPRRLHDDGAPCGRRSIDARRTVLDYYNETQTYLSLEKDARSPSQAKSDT